MPDYHVKMKVGSELFKFVVDPTTYSEVDIVDFAPRTVASMPSRSELGLYLDVGQESFAHGYGNERMIEAEMYAATGHLVDTSFGQITLMTNPTEINLNLPWWESIVKVYSPMIHVTYVLTDRGLFINRFYQGGFKRLMGPDQWALNTDILYNGRYTFISGNTLYVCDLQPANYNVENQTQFYVPDANWRPNIWAGGKIVIFDCPGEQERTIISNTANTITVNYKFSQTGTPPGFAFIYNQTGVSGNPPLGFSKLAIFGGYMWGFEGGIAFTRETDAGWAHYWTEVDGFDAEGGGARDIDAVAVGLGAPIVNVAVYNNQLWCFKRHGIWAIQQGSKQAFHLMDFTNEVAYENFNTVCIWNGFLVFNIGNDLYRYKSGLQKITPPDWDWTFPPKGYGRFISAAPRGKWLYVIGYASHTNPAESTQTKPFASLFRTDGVGWHKLLDLPDIEPWIRTVGVWTTGMQVSGMYNPVFQPSVYYTYKTSSITQAPKLFRIPLNPYSERPVPPYPTTGEHNWYSSFFDLGLVRIPKSYAEVTVDGEFPSGTSAICYVRVDKETSWTRVGTFNATTDTLKIPGNKTGKRVQIRLDLRTTNNQNTPVIKAVVIKQMARPEVLYGTSFEVIVESGLTDPNQGQLGMTAREIRAALKKCRASVQPIEFTDLWGEARPAYLASLRFIVGEYESEDDVAQIASRARVTVVDVE